MGVPSAVEWRAWWFCFPGSTPRRSLSGCRPVLGGRNRPAPAAGMRRKRRAAFPALAPRRGWLQMRRPAEPDETRWSPKSACRPGRESAASSAGSPFTRRVRRSGGHGGRITRRASAGRCGCGLEGWSTTHADLPREDGVTAVRVGRAPSSYRRISSRRDSGIDGPCGSARVTAAASWSTAVVWPGVTLVAVAVELVE